MIPFNKPYLTGKELQYIADAVESGKISGNGGYTKKCHSFFENRYSFKKCLLTTSCTDALEMCALLIDIKSGDEIIIPSFTFVSTCNAFILRGAKIIFADSQSTNPNLDASQIEKLITPKTKAIVVVHYAGISCDMDVINQIANEHGLFVIEDAAQSIDTYYKGKPTGSLGHLSAVSFHETKNVISGEGGMLIINDDQFVERAEIIWEKGTNRTAFFRGEVDKYGWVDLGSSFLPSELNAAFLYAQIENIDRIQNKRKHIWNTYNSEFKILEEKGLVDLPMIESYSTNNAHMFYLVTKNIGQRNRLISYLKRNNIHAVFHYLSLHKSDFFRSQYNGSELPNSDRYTNCLVRLPMFYELTDTDLSHIVNHVKQFYLHQK